MKSFRRKKYRRARTSFFGYQGGQGNILSDLLKLMPAHRLYCEVFGGSGTLLLNKVPSELEVFNDIDGDIVNLFLTVRDTESFEEFMDIYRWHIFSRKMYEHYRRIMRKTRYRATMRPNVERAAKYFYIMTAGFTSDPLPSTFSSSVSGSKARMFTNKVTHTLHRVHDRLKNVSIENLSFRKLIERYDGDDTFFMADPPYYNPTHGLYRYAMEKKDHKSLCRSIKKIDGLFLLTYDNVKAVRRMYRHFYQLVVESVVSITHRHDASGKVIAPGENKARQEHLFVANYDIEENDFIHFSRRRTLV